MRKEPIVPKNNNKSFKVDVFGDYFLTIFEILFAFVFIAMSFIALFMIKMPEIKWTILSFGLLGLASFAPTDDGKLYNTFWKITIWVTTNKKVEQIKPKLSKDEKTGLIMYKTKKFKKYFAAFEVKTDSLVAQNEDIILMAFNNLEKMFLELGEVDWALTKHLEYADVKDMHNFIESVETNNNVGREIMKRELSGATSNAGGVITGRYYLILNSTTKNKILEAKKNLRNYSGGAVEVVELEDEEIMKVVLEQSDLNQNQNKIEFGFEKIKMSKGNDDLFARYLVFTPNRNVMNSFWLNSLAYRSDVKYTIVGNKKQASKVVSQLNKELTKTRLKLQRTSDFEKQQRYSDLMESLQMTISNLRGDEQGIYKTMVVVEVFDTDTKELKRKTRRLMHELRDNGARFISAFGDIKEIWKIKAPLGNENKKHALYRDLLSYTIAASWGFNSNVLNDEKGMLLGFNSAGATFWDPMMTNDDLQNDELGRMNLNVAILGGSGSGKSTLTQKFVNWGAITNQAIWVVDPKDEDYFGLARYYGGEIIEFGVGKYKINPFEIIGWENLDLEERLEEITNLGGFLDGWLDILFEDKDFKNRIIEVVKEKYKGIEKKNKVDWLTFTKLKEEFIKRGGGYVDAAHKFSVYENEQHFFNGESTIKSLYEKDFVVFQTSKIFSSTSESFKNASLVLLTQLLTAKAKANRTSGKRFHAVIDEAHNFFNTKVGKLKLETLIREARGWSSGVVLISQNPQDFLGGKVMNNITVTFYGSLDALTTKQLSENLSINSSEEGLNDQEKEFILNAKRGQFLVLIAGKQKVTLQVKMSDIEFKAIKDEADIDWIKSIEHLDQVLAISKEEEIFEEEMSDEEYEEIVAINEDNLKVLNSFFEDVSRNDILPFVAKEFGEYGIHRMSKEGMIELIYDKVIADDGYFEVVKAFIDLMELKVEMRDLTKKEIIEIFVEDLPEEKGLAKLKKEDLLNKYFEIILLEEPVEDETPKEVVEEIQNELYYKAMEYIEEEHLNDLNIKELFELIDDDEWIKTFELSYSENKKLWK